MTKEMRCPNCAEIVKRVCAYCWRCSKCCDCNEKGKRWVNGHLENDKKKK